MNDGSKSRSHRTGRQRWRRWLMLGLTVFGLVFLPYLYSRVASGWRCVSIHSATTGASPVQSLPDRIRVVSYNIAHGRGNAESTANWTGELSSQRLDRLNAIADLLHELNADLVVLNEVDFDASWSFRVNQARHIAKRAGYPYWVEQRNLDFRFLFWTWRFGNVVLSRYPIQSAKEIPLPDYAKWETVLAGKKRGVLCEIGLGAKILRIAGVHLCHRSEERRVQSAGLLLDLAKQSGTPLLVVGDLNSTPPGFPLSLSDSNGQNAMATFDASKRFKRSPQTFQSASNMTYHSTNRLEVIDWILIPTHWEFLDYGVAPSTLSDHRLIHAEILRKDSAFLPSPFNR